MTAATEKIYVEVRDAPFNKGCRVQLFDATTLRANWTPAAIDSIHRSLKNNGDWCRVDGKLALRATIVQQESIWYEVT